MKKSLLALIILNVLVLLPILFLCFYNYPSADDFSYGVALKNNSFMDIQIDRYFDWTSRYFATAVLTITPLAFNSMNYFGVYSIIFILLFVIGFLYFFKSIGIDNLKKRLLLSTSFLSIYTLLLCSLSENFYWLAGSITYFLPSIIFIIFLGSILNILNKNELKDKLIFLISILILGGCSEIYLGFSFITLLLVNIYQFLKFKKNNNFLLIGIFLAILLIGFVLFSPGNKARSETHPQGFTFFELIYLSLKKFVVINIRYNIIGFIFLVVLARIINIKIDILNKLSIWNLLLIMNSFLFIGIIVSIYGVKGNFPPRVENMLIFVSFFFLLFIAIKVIDKYNLKNKSIYLIGAIVAIAYIFIPKNDFQKDSNIKLIYKDIFLGKVFSFKDQFIQRDKILKTCNENCEIEPFVNPPRSLMFKDASDDENSYINKSMAIFYNLKTVKVMHKENN
ncbi:hypothetical protein HXZ94_07185 [Empedobacter falsenii]|uniref:DUF6056 family protein n=1 Tax=Empedobacter falsenii TaxID=343874 RepID=UPI0025780045|nr:DUF6056 family protein [Empedobacter falsenii]MDM1298283.1 hypothetical protein [Empedobacter falsenii]MDM1318160.1 hypothetical protein [Empedobacter falsenii]